MELILEQKDAAEWIYKGEGAANIVLSYTGSSPSFVGRVMRIPKAPKNAEQWMNGTSGLTTHEKLLWRDNEELISAPNKETVDLMFVKHVMRPLLGHKHVDAGIPVLVSREFLESVDMNVNCQRPASRVDAGKVDTSRDSVLLMSDHSIFSRGLPQSDTCICVEIKPKCGFLPLSKFITERNQVKNSISRFTMHQVLKLRKKEISELSEYDPLDLFSGSKDRICKAITSLYATPQNNFRVFLNGSLVFGSLGGLAKATSFAVGQAFEDVLKDIIDADDGLRTMSFIQLIAETVYSSGVLDRLSKVQKLDNLDIEGVIHAYYDVISQPCIACRELDKKKVSPQYSSLHSLPFDESLKIVKDYMIAATAKDCSLMVSLRPRKDDGSESSYNSIYLQSTNQIFDYKVYFIDLDLKPLKKMEYYYNLDKKIVTSYMQVLETEEKVKGLSLDACKDSDATAMCVLL